MKCVPIVIAAGGTGGHFYPAEALAAALIARGHWVVLMTDARAVVPKSTRVRRAQSICAARRRHRRTRRRAGRQGGLRAGRRSGASARSIMAPYPAGRGGGVRRLSGCSTGPRRASVALTGRRSSCMNRTRCSAGPTGFWRATPRVLALSFADTSRVPAKVRRLVTGNPVRPAVTALSEAEYEPRPARNTMDRSWAGRSGCWSWAARSARASSVRSCPRRIARLPDAIRVRLAGHAAMPRRGPGPGPRDLRRQRDRRRTGAILPGRR